MALASIAAKVLELMLLNRCEQFICSSDKKCGFEQSLLIISPVARCAATWTLELELKLFQSNNVRMPKATEMCTARS